MRRYPSWPIHVALLVVSTIMLVPFYWVLKTSLTGENIFAFPPALLPEDPHPFFYVDVWYAIPFFRYLVNSVIVSVVVVAANVVLNGMAGYALTRDFPRQGDDHPAVPELHDDPLPGDHHSGLSDHLRTGAAEFLCRDGAAAEFDHRLHLHLQGGVRGHPEIARSTRPGSTACPTG